jgi:hypothetical protein
MRLVSILSITEGSALSHRRIRLPITLENVGVARLCIAKGEALPTPKVAAENRLLLEIFITF